MCLPFEPYISPTPFMARLMASVEPEVKTISLAEALRIDAICSRAVSTASSAFQPNAWLRLAAFP